MGKQTIYKRIKPFKYLNNLPISRKWLWIGVCLVLLYIFVGGHSGFYAQVKLWQEERDLKKEIQYQTKKQEWLNEEEDRLENDLARIEKEAREKYMMGKKDEIIIKVKE